MRLSRLPFKIGSLGSVSYTHLDVYKRQLQYGTKEKVIDEAKKLMDVLAPGGGYIFTVAKGITYPNDGTPENVRALYEFVESYGKY